MALAGETPVVVNAVPAGTPDESMALTAYKRSDPLHRLHWPRSILTRCMRLCRFGHNRFGVADGDRRLEVSAALEMLAPSGYPLRGHDLPVASLDRVAQRQVRHGEH